jgi:hypothetical protein
MFIFLTRTLVRLCVIGSILCTAILSAATITTECTAKIFSHRAPNETDFDQSPCQLSSPMPPFVPPTSFSFTNGDAVVSGTINGTDMAAALTVAGGGGTSLFAAGADGTVSYSADTAYIVPGSGAGTIHAIVYARHVGEGTCCNYKLYNGRNSFTLGDTVYSCYSTNCFGGALGTLITISQGDYIYAETGTFALGQVFDVGFSMSQQVLLNDGEQGDANIDGGFSSLQFFDAAGNPVTPTAVPTPEPMMALPVGVALTLLCIAVKRRQRPHAQ